MLTFLLNLIVFILVLGVIILLHELGHFLLAKRFNVLCHEYAIGMGPAIYQYKKGETTYSIRAIPIGGFVSLAGEDNNDAMFSLEDTIGLKLNEEGKVVGIVLSVEIEHDVLGKIVEYELFDREKEGLYIKLEQEDGTIERYEVIDEAKYYWGRQKEMQIAPKERSLNSKPIWQRFLVLFAGPLMNFVLAFFLFLLAFTITGKPVDEAVFKKTDPNGPMHEVVDTNFTIEEINGISVESWQELSLEIQKYPGQEVTFKIKDRNDLVVINTQVSLNILGISNAGYEDEQLKIGQPFGIGTGSKLEAGDVVTKVNGVEVTTWQELVDLISTTKLTSIKVDYLRDGTAGSTEYAIYPASTLIGQGVMPAQVLIGVERMTKFNFGYALKMGFVQIGTETAKIFRILGGLFAPNKTGVKVTGLAGPIGIFNIIAQVRVGGFVAILLFMGFLSINIGLINLLPIPALDGGRILFLGVELVTRKPLNRKVETWVNNIAFGLLMLLFVFIMVFDVIRLF